LPKSSHCGACNNCVKGYDHHCTLLNNCVGQRNLRSFILLLVSTWTFFTLSGIIAAIGILWETYDKEYEAEGHIDLDFDFYANIGLVVFQIIKFILLGCMRHCITFNTAIIWTGVEAVIVLGVAISTLEGDTIVLAPLLSLGFSLMLFVWPLLTKHMNFIVHHLTEKEFHARLETMNRLQIEDELIKSVTFAQKCRNL